MRIKPSLFGQAAVVVAVLVLLMGTAFPLSAPSGANAPIPTREAWPGVLQQDLIANTNNYYPARTFYKVYGRASSVNATRVDLWEGPTASYVFPATAQQMKVVSTSASDAASGVGVQKVGIHYLDDSYNEHLEQVTLNGASAVATVATNIFRVNSLHSTQIGTNGSPVGNISLTNTAGTVTYAFQIAGFNTARQAIYTVPAGKTFYLSHWQGSSGSSGSYFCQTDVRATTHDGILWPSVFLIQDGLATQNGGYPVTLPTPIPIPATADMKMTSVCNSGSANAAAIGTFMGWTE
jgi:hypothetical protein